MRIAGVCLWISAAGAAQLLMRMTGSAGNAVHHERAARPAVLR
jgi:hypothetical protein